MTYDKIERVMSQINTVVVFTESRIHNLHGDNLNSDHQEMCEERIKRAKQEIFELLQAK